MKNIRLIGAWTSIRLGGHNFLVRDEALRRSSGKNREIGVGKPKYYSPTSRPMPIEAMVINASPLITSYGSGQVDLLPRLFTHIVVPDAVWQEMALYEWEDAVAREPSQQSWPVRLAVVSSPRVARVGSWRRRDSGIETGAGQRAVIDELDAHLIRTIWPSGEKHLRPPACNEKAAEYRSSIVRRCQRI